MLAPDSNVCFQPDQMSSGRTRDKRGRSSNRQLPPGLESRVCDLIRDSYADFGPTLACEAARAPRHRSFAGVRTPDHDRRGLLGAPESAKYMIEGRARQNRTLESRLCL